MAIIEQKIPEWKEKELKRISEETLDEVLEKLNKNNRVLAVRPTGFGKSYMLTGLTSDKIPDGTLRFKNCLYIYPTTVIKEDVMQTYGPNGKDERAGRLQNTTFISYKKLTNMILELENTNKTSVAYREVYKGIYDVGKENKKSNIEEIIGYQGEKGLRNWFRKFDLIMMDECHRAGAEGFLKTWNKISSIITSSENTKLVGVTATPDRLDGIDIKEIFGKTNQISRLTLADCIQKELLSRFDYIYVIGDRERFLTTTIDDINKKRVRNGDSELQQYELDELQSGINRIPSISEVIKKSVTEENTGGSNYMKFVVFFRDRSHIKKSGNIVESWFNDAFETMDVRVHNIVTKTKSEDLEYEISDTDKLTKLIPTENVVDLIFCVDKLNMGYHVESITGVILLRETSSAIIYNQQIGRCFSVRSMNKPIIIDIIDKCGAGSLIAKELEDGNKDSLNKGSKKELPSILNKNCVDVTNYSIDFIKLSASMRLQRYNRDEELVRFLSINRHAPVDIISQMTGLKIEKIEEILKQEA